MLGGRLLKVGADWSIRILAFNNQGTGLVTETHPYDMPGVGEIGLPATMRYRKGTTKGRETRLELTFGFETIRIWRGEVLLVEVQGLSRLRNVRCKSRGCMPHGELLSESSELGNFPCLWMAHRRQVEGLVVVRK